MKNKWKILLIITISLIVFLVLFFLIPTTCENDFKAYSEKGYCEFNLKTCEGLFGCREYNNIQVPCGSVSTLCGEKVLCDCSEKEPLSYFANNITVSKEYRPFSYTSEKLKKMSDECGVEHNDSYFNKLVEKFSSTKEIVYTFKNKNSNQDSSDFVVTLIPNEAKYSSLDEFQKDFDLCAAGGDLYPTQLSEDWLLFENSCGSGAGNNFENNFSCDEIREIVEPSLKLN